jgi:hypothetical protein
VTRPRSRAHPLYHSNAKRDATKYLKFTLLLIVVLAIPPSERIRANRASAVTRPWLTEMQPGRPVSVPSGGLRQVVGGYLLAEINKWAPYVALDTPRKAAPNQADTIATTQIAQGHREVIVSLWQKGGVPNGETITPVEGMGAVIDNKIKQQFQNNSTARKTPIRMREMDKPDEKKPLIYKGFFNSGGETGIRTPDRL